MPDSLQNIGLKQIRSLVPTEEGLELGDDLFILNVKYSDDLQFLKYPCRSDAYIAIFCRTGNLTVELNLRAFPIHKNSLLISTPGNIVKVREFDSSNVEDLEFTVMAISKEFISGISFDFKKIFDDRFSLLAEPVTVLDENDIAFCTKYVQLFREIINSDSTNKREASASLTASMFYVIGGMLEKNFDKGNASPKEATQNMRVKLLFEHFMQLVTEYHNSERNMAFYANRLGLTPKYLSKLIREVSGRSAPDWIDSFVILEAKNMLKYTNASIKEIVYKLHFPNPSVFYKFFKAHTGMTPSEYRNG